MNPRIFDCGDWHVFLFTSEMLGYGHPVRDFLSKLRWNDRSTDYGDPRLQAVRTTAVDPLLQLLPDVVVES